MLCYLVFPSPVRPRPGDWTEWEQHMTLNPLPHCPLMGSARAAEFMHASSLARSELGACRMSVGGFRSPLGGDNSIIRPSP